MRAAPGPAGRPAGVNPDALKRVLQAVAMSSLNLRRSSRTADKAPPGIGSGQPLGVTACRLACRQA